MGVLEGGVGEGKVGWGVVGLPEMERSEKWGTWIYSPEGW